MKIPDIALNYLTNLMEKSDDLHYIDQDCDSIMVIVQSIDLIVKCNSDKSNISMLSNSGVVDAIIIGDNEYGIPIILDYKTIKTYLVDFDVMEPGEYLSSEIFIRH